MPKIKSNPRQPFCSLLIYAFGAVVYFYLLKTVYPHTSHAFQNCTDIVASELDGDVDWLEQRIVGGFRRWHVIFLTAAGIQAISESRTLTARPNATQTCALKVVCRLALAIWSYWYGCRERIFLNITKASNPLETP